MHLRDDRDISPRLDGSQGGPLARETGPHHHYVVTVHRQNPRAPTHAEV
jgi:hypothetical protein